MSLARSGVLLALLALLSKLLGFVRDAVIAHRFGGGDAYQAFVIASAVPTLMMNIFLGGAVVGALVPAFLRRRAGPEGEAGAWSYASGTFLVLFGVSVVAAGALFFFSGAAVALLGPGLSPAAQALATAMARWLVWSIPVLLASTVLGAILNADDRFIGPGWRNAANNLVFTAVVIVGGGLGDGALVWGFVGGALIQLLIQLPETAQTTPWQLARPRFFAAEAREMLATYTPVLATHAMLQGIVLLDRPYSSLATAGGAAAYAYAERFVEIGRSVLASSLAVVIFPRLSRALRDEDTHELIGAALGLVALFAVPLGALLGGYGEPLIALAYQRGEFSHTDTLNVATALVGLAGTPLTYGAIYMIDRQLIARQRVWRWSLAMGLGLAVNWLVKQVTVPLWGLAGVAFGTLAGTAATAIIGLVMIRLGGATLRRVGHDLGASLVCFLVPLGLLHGASAGLGWAWARGLIGALLLGVVGSAAILLWRPPALRQVLDFLARRSAGRSPS